MERVVRVRMWVVLVLCCGALVCWLPLTLGANGANHGGLLAVHYLDIGQGDATFIETPDGVQLLIDGGPDGSVLNELGKILPWRDHRIDVILATHPDSDHISGLIDVLERFTIDTIIMTENQSDTPTAAAFAAAVKAEGAEVIYARAGQVVQLGASTTLEILFPVTDPTELESNTSSIVSILHYGEDDFVFTGDSPQLIERYLVDAYGSSLQSEVLKAGHHGSKTSSAPEFVAAVAPNYAVISAGRNNRYGHPHQQTLDTLSASRIETLRADEQGSITLLSDGSTITVE